MHERILAGRYAAALFRAAQAGHLVDQVEADLRQIDILNQRAPRFVEILKQPLLPPAEKDRIIERALVGKVAATTLSFLKLLVAKRRAGLLPLVYGAFQSFAEELRNEARLLVTSAVPLTEPEKAQLTEALSWRTGKVLKPQFAVDAMLIGGVIARIGDTVYDGSVRSQLRELAAKLTFGRA